MRKSALLFLPAILACGQTGTQSRMDATPTPVAMAPERPLPQPIDPPAFYEDAVEAGTRTPQGAPGPAYWQQWTDYDIRVRLDPENNRVDGQATIVYHNNSPDELPVVLIQLIQNHHAEGAMRNSPAEVTGGVELKSVRAGGTDLSERNLQSGPGYIVQGTQMVVRPPSPIQPGGTVELEIEWGFVVPQAGASGRMGWSRGNLYYIAYWYPQLSVYDDVYGWFTDPFLGGAEFYAGFGTYNVEVEAPDGWVVWGTGELQNANEVLPPPVLARLNRAMATDSVVTILQEGQFGPGSATMGSPDGWLRWRFSADSVRDFTFSATTESRWDATRSNVGDRDGDGIDDYVGIHAFWREDVAPRWQHSARFSQHSIGFLSRFTGVPYPWPHMTAVEGTDIIGGGMEHPMMTIIGPYNNHPLGDEGLYNVTAHEEAHMWVPMIIATNEVRHAWMDEGSTVFNENQARKEFYPGRDHDDPDRQGYIGFARTGNEGEMMRWTDYQYPNGSGGVASYPKPATALVALRKYLGEDRFNEAWQNYLQTWAFKHPQPWDFFASMESSAGEDLDWFFYSWYFTTWTLDQAVTGLSQTDNRATITVEDLGDIPMPVYLTITLQNGSEIERVVPVEAWLSGRRSASIDVAISSPVVSVEIDPEGILPDLDRSNNRLER